MSKRKVTTDRMFKTDDLPLFSQTAQTGYVDRYIGHEVQSQASFAKCAVCLDTGKVGDKACWCEAGDKVREQVSPAQPGAILWHNEGSDPYCGDCPPDLCEIWDLAAEADLNDPTFGPQDDDEGEE